MRVGALLGVLSALALTGCVTTSMQGYADNTPPSHPITHIAAYVAAPIDLRDSLERSLADEANKHGVIAVDALSIFPPTRTYSNAEIRSGLAARGIDGVLVLSVGDTGVRREYAGTIFQGQSFGTYTGSGTINTFVNTANISYGGSYSGSSFGTATPIYRYRRTTRFTAKLIDPATGRILWVGGGQVNVGGLLFVGNGTSAASSTSAIFDDLAAKGIIARTSS
jgi:hypothetical protein